jgi:hypothetical protein
MMGNYVGDLVAWDDLDANASECADPIQELRQDLYHRLIEAPGSNIDDPDRGFGIYQKLNKPMDVKTAKLIELEMQKDDRVDSCECTVTNTGSGTYKIEIDCVADGQEMNLTLATTPQGVTVVNK